jgi:hypothetical protein
LIDIAAKTTARDVAAVNKSLAMDLGVIGSLLRGLWPNGQIQGSKLEGSLPRAFGDLWRVCEEAVALYAW